MREESAYRVMDSGSVRRGGETDPLAGAREVNRAARSVALSADKVILLVRRAMNCLESDRKAALRCLSDVSALLGSYGRDSGASPFEVLSGFRPGGLARWQARRALAHIEENLGSKLATAELAGLVSFSKSHFSRAFKRSLGISPMAYVARRRVERAKAMMITTDRQLTEIALICGFADQSHLNRSFRRAVGMSPGRWRRTSADVDEGVSGALPQ
ncbi:MAG TPA: AraC family transcriptional regulator [Steroidobacteraceae bacterium]|nr:AraC family transcriptional regulator [Steroidobacteraceae bacterium]